MVPITNNPARATFFIGLPIKKKEDEYKILKMA
jgi:hypothetical protein